MKIMGASFLLGGMGLTGCRRPEEALFLFPKCLTIIRTVLLNILRPPCRFGILRFRLVKSSDGRPTKIEGNPDLSEGGGGTDTFAQASLLNLYDPDRSRHIS